MLKFEKAIFGYSLLNRRNHGTYVREIKPDVFEIVEVTTVSDEFMMINNYEVNFNSLTTDFIESELSHTDYTYDDIKKEFGNKYKQAVSEYVDIFAMCNDMSHHRRGKEVFVGAFTEGLSVLKEKFEIELV